MISIFLALGIGILIGASLSDNIIVKQQRELVERMEERITLLNEKITGLQENNDLLNSELVSWMQIQEKIIPQYVEARLEGYEVAVIYENRDRETIHSVLAFLEDAGIQVQRRIKIDIGKLEKMDRVNLEGKEYYLSQHHHRKDYLRKLTPEITECLLGNGYEKEVGRAAQEFLSVERKEAGMPDKILYFPGEIEARCSDLHNLLISSFKDKEASFVLVYLTSTDEQQHAGDDYPVVPLGNDRSIIGKLDLLNLLELDFQEKLSQ